MSAPATTYVDPAADTAADTAGTAPAGQPATTGPRGYAFELPVGYVDADGRVHRTATLRKMTGRDEALMADRHNRGNGARLITELLGACLLRLGTLERPGTAVAQALYSADRHFLLMKLREITFGPEMDASYTCPTCREATIVVEDLASLEVVSLDDGGVPADVVVRLEDGYQDRSGEVYDTLVFRYATGADEEKVAGQIRDNPSHGKNALMARCLRSIGNMSQQRMEALGTAIFADLTLSDRALIDRALNNGSPGIRMRRDIHCAGCGRSYGAALDLSNFLAPS
jgi:hypothetical protein